MVKGISRRVIVVRSPDPRFFEQAIFLMKEDAFHNSTVSADQVVAEARQAAAGYLRRSAGTCSSTWRSWLPKALWFALGGCVIAAVWGLSFLWSENSVVCCSDNAFLLYHSSTSCTT